jgi:hypothetical protein
VTAHSKKLRAVAARVEDFSVILQLSDGTTVERDFSFVREGVCARLWRGDRLDPRVRIRHGVSLTWPNEIDFELDLILWGWPRSRARRPLARALVGCGGSLIPAPIVRDL